MQPTVKERIYFICMFIYFVVDKNHVYSQILVHRTPKNKTEGERKKEESGGIGRKKKNGPRKGKGEKKKKEKGGPSRTRTQLLYVWSSSLPLL